MYGLSFIRRNRRKLKRAAVFIAGLLTILALAVAFLCARLEIHSYRDIAAYRTMAREHYPPVWKDLALRRITRGDRLEDLLREHPPVHRDDFESYTDLDYIPPGSYKVLGVIAKDGRLIVAHASGGTWRHVFFGSSEEEKAYTQQKLLEGEAFRIHRAIKGGQDVFLARPVERSKVLGESPCSQATLEQMRIIYGQDYLDGMGPAGPELTVEVTNVLYGDLQVGTKLTFPGGSCGLAETGEREAVFLHFEDMRLIFPQYDARESYMTVPRGALDWYQSLTADQAEALEARRLAAWAQ